MPNDPKGLAEGPGKIALFNNIPAPYHITHWNYMARKMKGRFAVRFLASSEAGRWWEVPTERMEFEWAFLCRSNTINGAGIQLRGAAAMLGFLFRYRPSSVVCAGYDTLAAWAALLWCKITGRRFALWLVGTVRDLRKPSQTRTFLKRRFIAAADAIAAGGKSAVEYVKSLGARNEQIFLAPQGCDNRWLQRETAQVNVEAGKKRHGLPPHVVLYSGRLDRRKGAYVLLEAYQRISPELRDVGLALVGDGPERKGLQAYSEKEQLKGVHFLGQKEYLQMPMYYALADIIVLPTFSDTWGWVVNEAMACGLPAIVSRAAGACEDLVIDGETGFVVEPGDVEGLAAKILRLMKDDALRARMSANCRRRIERYSAEACAEGLLAAALGKHDEGSH